MFDELKEAIMKLAEPFKSLADAFRELNELLNDDDSMTPKEYAQQKYKRPHQKDICHSSYNYMPQPRRNLPYQRRIY